MPELKAQFGVTEMTIRRDLEKLEHTGEVRRTFGGAIMVTGVSVARRVSDQAVPAYGTVLFFAIKAKLRPRASNLLKQEQRRSG